MDGGPVTPRVLYLGFDACDAGIVERLAAEGRCPTFASLLEGGAVVDTIAPYGTFVGSSWMTIATGTHVGRHRFFNWVEIDRDTYEPHTTSPRDARGTPFWQRLSEAGRRVAVLDVPHCDLPADGFDGVVVKEWGCHDRHHGTAAYPADVLEELDARVGRHPYAAMEPPYGDPQFAPCDYTLRSARIRTLDEERRLREQILRGITRKQEMSLAVLERDRWDLFASVFGEGHCAGHQLWHVHDRDHPRHDPAAAALLGDPVEEAYQWLDAALAAHLEQVGDDTTVYVQLNHGMGPHYDGHHLLDEVLRRLDGALGGAEPGWRTRLARRALDHLPARARRTANRAVAAGVRRRSASAPPVRSQPTGPRPDRRVFQLDGNSTVGAVRVNVVGRESEGLVHPGAELDELCEQLREGLLGLVDVATGRPAVRAVIRSDEVLERSPDDAFPDLFVEWERSSLVEQVWSPVIGTVAAPYEHWRTGDHNDRGLLIARGPGIAPGRRGAPISLVDVAPTICASLGVELPGIDGRAHADLVGGADAPAAAVAPARSTIPLPSLGAIDAPRRTRRAGRATDEARSVADGALELADAAARRADSLEETVERLRIDLAVTRAGLAAARGELAQQLTVLHREQLVWTTMAWLAREEVVEDELVTVITPTHERPAKLRRAIGSVLAQRYGRWELVVIDDGGDTAKGVVASVGDDRIRVIEVPHGGAPAARNAGLDVATGSIITYLDDDNSFDPGWLHAVVWAFRNHPDHHTLYGARIVDDLERVHERGSGGWPWVQFSPFDRAALEQGNFADMGVIAHRAGLPEARFDESLLSCADWDLFLALTEHHPALELPAVAVHYRTDGDDRLTDHHRGYEDPVREKWAARRAARDGEPA